jgi:uncharacterized protein YxeA
MKNSKNIIIITLLVLLLLIGAIIFAGTRLQNTQISSNGPILTTNQNSEQQPEQIAAEQSANQQKFKYEFVSDQKEGEAYDWKNQDGKIVQTNLQTGIQTVLIPSVRKAYPDPKLVEGVALYPIAESINKPYLYFARSYIEGAEGIIRFDASTKKFTELKISDYYQSFMSQSAKTAPFIATTHNVGDATDERSLFLLDLDKDTRTLLLKLPQNQTFNPCKIEGCIGDQVAVIEWLDQTSFQITIYNPVGQTVDQDGNTRAKIIEKRKFKIN